MLIGLKYCGGCRANYDRRAEAERFIRESNKRQSADPITVVPADPGVKYDELLVVCGCKARCPYVSDYSYERIVYIDEPS